MKTLNFDYDINTSSEVKSELDKIAGMSTDEICKEYVLDPEDVEEFLNLMKEDYATLLLEENRGCYINDRNEDYAQLYNFL